MQMDGVQPTLSPSMDIQVSSNFERLLFELWGRDGAAVAETMLRFRDDGRFEVDADRMGLLREQWSAASVDDDATIESSASCTPDSACSSTRTPRSGWEPRPSAAPIRPSPMVAMATAHPAKFPDAVEAATGVRPPLPERLADLFDRPERYDTVPADYAAVARRHRRRHRLTGPSGTRAWGYLA